jgi:hypothetical protein
MNILCTTTAIMLEFGLYKIRCKDFATWTKQCAPKVNITTGISIDDVISKHTNFDFDSTIIIKHVPDGSLEKKLPGELGDIYIDVGDNYQLNASMINADFTVILQNTQHKENFPIANMRW